MAVSVFFTFLLLISFLIIFYILISALRSHHFSMWRFSILLCNILIFIISILYFMPVQLSEHDSPIITQTVYSTGTNDEIQTITLDKFPNHLKIRRYRLGDHPMPGQSFGTMTVHIELTLENGKSCTLSLCPGKPESSQILIYDEPYQGRWFLTRESAEYCILQFLTNKY